MFGPKMHIAWEGFGVTLRPLKKLDMANVAEKMSDPTIQRYTKQIYGFTQEAEEAWYQRNGDDKDAVSWGIVPDEYNDVVIGITSIHGIHSQPHSGKTGIIIFNKDFWGKGVASRAHLIRTFYAAVTLDLATLRSDVKEPNAHSRMALERVGYMVTGKYPRAQLVEGEFVDELKLTWWNPVWVPRLFPEGVPADYQDAIERAKVALQKGVELINK